jgi:diacylglycerol kinase family enzyme
VTARSSLGTNGSGEGLAIVVNANAKRGGRRVAAQIARALPGAEVRLTKSIAELEAWLRNMKKPRCIISAGGDGTAVALLNALDHVTPKDQRFPPIGAFPLGTGNAWAHALGAKKLDACVRALKGFRGELPTRKYDLLDCEGTLTFFAGCGWDAQILDDYREQVEQSPSSRLAKSVWGYVSAMLLRTVPKSIMYGRPHVLIENLAEEAYTIDRQGVLAKMPDVARGTVLYEGMASVTGAATCPEFGYRFRAYPNAMRMRGYLNVRVYDEKTITAITQIPQLWVGAPLPGMHDFFSKHVKMTFSRVIPLEIGGEAIGTRQTVEYKASEREVDALDWRRL